LTETIGVNFWLNLEVGHGNDDANNISKKSHVKEVMRHLAGNYKLCLGAWKKLA
jgi:hypothetical protein